MDILKVTFKSTESAACLVYSAMSQVSPIVGTLTSGMCGGVFYCDISAKDNMNRPAGYKGFYKLYEPNSYGLTIDEGFVIIKGNSMIQSTEIVNSDSIVIPSNVGGQMIRFASPRATAGSTPTESESTIDAKRLSYQRPVTEEYSETILSKLKTVNTNFNIPFSDIDYEKMKLDNLIAFNKHNIPIPGSKLAKAFPRVFFTRPDLNLFGESARSRTAQVAVSVNELTSKIKDDPWFAQTYNTDPYLLASLTKAYTNQHDFIPFLSNMAQSFDLSDEKLESIEHGETFTGWKVKYGRHNNGTKSAGSFSISYNETNRLEVYKIHKAWVDYISKVYRGEINATSRHIKNMILDYACSVYYFLCAEDGETVLFWSKYIGVFPTSIPAGQFTWSKDNIIKMPECSVEYDYAWKEDMDPASLADFNFNANVGEASPARSYMYDTNILGGGYTFAGRPFIRVTKDSEGKFVVKLRYAKE